MTHNLLVILVLEMDYRFSEEEQKEALSFLEKGKAALLSEKYFKKVEIRTSKVHMSNLVTLCIFPYSEESFKTASKDESLDLKEWSFLTKIRKGKHLRVLQCEEIEI
jgi:hypothetical protein